MEEAEKYLKKLNEHNPVFELTIDCEYSEEQLLTFAKSFAKEEVNKALEKNDKWHSIDEKELPKDRMFISKSSNDNELICLLRWNKSNNKFNPVMNSIHYSKFSVKNISHWKEVVKNVKKVCPRCGYPKFKNSFESFERCEGCEWTSAIPKKT